MSNSPKTNTLLRQWTGPLTQELVRVPGSFGLGQLPAQLKPHATTSMVCGFCSTGCGLNIHLNQDGQAIGLTPTTEYPVNLGMACPKGWEALSVLNASDRATTPLLRNASDKLVPVDWKTALQTFADRFKSIQQKYGPDSLAWIGTGQIVTEELALLGAVAKFGMGIIHGDGNTRQCMASAAVAYKQSFGFDAPPYTYQDFEESDVIVLIGSNLCIAHPIMWERICRNPYNPQIIVIDPRKTETAMAASLHLPLAPKSDLTLLYGLANILIQQGWIDPQFVAEHTNDFPAFANHVKAFSIDHVSAKSGINRKTLLKVARIIHEGKRVSFWWTMGVNQSHEGVRTAQAIINLALMTGNIGRPGTGANSVTGQCNAMGSRLFSNTTNLLGGRDFTSATDRNDVARILGIGVERIPARNSWPYDQIIDGIASEKIKGLWIVATNTLHSWIGKNDLHRMLKKLDFLVVQDMYYTTDTALRADLVLPAAAWGEKDGTFINSERRIGVVKKVSRAPGQALSDFAIVKLLAHAWGCGEMFRRWESPEATFEILKDLGQGRPFDFSGISNYREIDETGGIQWPWSIQNKQDSPNGPAQQRRLFEDGRFYHADGKAKFIFEAARPTTESPTDEYPFVLLTGRGTAVQWHTQTRSEKSPVLRQLYPRDVYVEMNPGDAHFHNIEPSEWVMVESRRGSIRARAFLTPCIQPSQIFIPMHYAATNQLTDPVFDPHSRQPSYKWCAVNVRKIEHWEVNPTIVDRK